MIIWRLYQFCPSCPYILQKHACLPSRTKLSPLCTRSQFSSRPLSSSQHRLRASRYDRSTSYHVFINASSRSRVVQSSAAALRLEMVRIFHLTPVSPPEEKQARTAVQILWDRTFDLRKKLAGGHNITATPFSRSFSAGFRCVLFCDNLLRSVIFATLLVSY